jgi:hypothetical protein
VGRELHTPLSMCCVLTREVFVFVPRAHQRRATLAFSAAVGYPDTLTHKECYNLAVLVVVGFYERAGLWV